MANKNLGQHWLNDQTILQSMIKAAGVGPEDEVLEIGPGQGSLTLLLLKHGAKVIAVELDSELVGKLQAELADNPQLELVQGDILDFDLRQMGPKYKVIANIPYYLTGKLLRKLLEATSPPSSIVLLVQKEVAERITARPGQMSILAVVAQYYSDVSLGLVVKAELFSPAPKVDSQVVILQPKRTARSEDSKLFRLVKIGFSARRKKLANNLSAGLVFDKVEAKTALQTCGLDELIRAQELGVEDWLCLEESLNGES